VEWDLWANTRSLFHESKEFREDSGLSFLTNVSSMKRINLESLSGFFKGKCE
jgi:hypothetical protein